MNTVVAITNSGARITIERQTEADARLIFNIMAESPNVQWVGRYYVKPKQ